LHLSRLAAVHPDKAAVVVAETGEVVTYRELDESSIRLARLLAARGLGAGDHVALLFDNRPEYFVAAWAAQRSGLVWTPVNHHLTAAEASYIVRDCGARALVASAGVADLAVAVAEQADDAGVLAVRLLAGGPAGDADGAARLAVAGFEELGAAVAGLSAEEPAGEREGARMYYSSGTTGQPKGILPALPDAPFGSGLALDRMLPGIFGFGPGTVYLCPAPLYHAAPSGWSLGTMRQGGTVVLMRRFDAERALAYVERYRVSHAQFVPTMLVRFLRLADGTRAHYDLSSLRVVVHAAAPCPVDVKRQVIEWLGPIVYEYYSGSEGAGFCMISSADWLAHPGSVGRALVGEPHIVDDDGNELPPGEVGTVWFSGGPDFAYHNDPDKTARARDARGWGTFGDVGRLDEDGYLYLVDRRVDLILSGGTNVYPQEVENVLALHPAVQDVAVVGIADPDLGRRVHALVQPADPREAGPELAADIVAYCRDRLAHYKCPRGVEFVDALPRTPTGKLLRRLLHDRPVVPAD
jgi:acyl-CoA synthetase (AMP-forming)/AMP-acid ligase II